MSRWYDNHRIEKRIRRLKHARAIEQADDTAIQLLGAATSLVHTADVARELVNETSRPSDIASEPTI